MSLIDVFRSRKADPFAGVERERRPAPPATDYATRIDVAAKAAEIVAQAQGRPPWDTAPQPGRPDLLADEAHRLYGWDITAMDYPPAHHRRYVPDPLTAPLARRPLSFAADFRELPAFRAAVRAAGHAPAGRVRAAGFPALPDFRIPELMHKNFAGMLAMHLGRAA